MPSEYRLRWKREGRGWAYRIYQTEAAARRKVDGILALEEIKGDTTQWENLPDLNGEPELQVREVGEWGPADRPLGALSNDTRKRVAAWAGVTIGYEGRASDPEGGPWDATDPEDIPF